MSLSIFVDKQTVTALSDTDAQHLDSLIDINKNLAEGLLMNAGDDPQKTNPDTPNEQASDISI